MSNLFDQILDGKLSDDEITSALVQLADRGETAEEIAAAAQAMRARMVTAKAPAGAIDVCGTGGDGQHRIQCGAFSGTCTYPGLYRPCPEAR